MEKLIKAFVDEMEVFTGVIKEDPPGRRQLWGLKQKSCQ